MISNAAVYYSSITNVDWKYQIWQAGVTITDNVCILGILLNNVCHLVIVRLAV